MRPGEPILRHEDAWFLFSVLSAGNGWVPLQKVIENGDWVNHAVFTLAEIRGAAARLSAVGLLEVRGTEFRATKGASELWSQARSRRILDHLDRLHHLIGASEYDPSSDPNAIDPTWDYEGVTQEDFDRAFNAYEAELPKWVRKLINRPHN